MPGLSRDRLRSSFADKRTEAWFAPCAAGTVELDAHTAILTLCVFLFISFPFGVATASTIRVGNLLGAGRPQQARLAGAARSLVFMPQNRVISLMLCA